MCQVFPHPFLIEMPPNARIISIKVLSGGSSGTLKRVFLKDEKEDYHWIWKQYGTKDLKQNPKIALQVAVLLRHLLTQGLKVPKPVGTPIYKGYPTLVSTFIAHSPKVQATPQEMAHTLTDIHRIPYLENLPQDKQPFQKNPNTLLHGDFWPGNILCKNKEVVGIIDWEDACIGDPLLDFSRSRLEILWAQDIEAMNHFSRVFQVLNPHIDYAHLPLWDLYTARTLGGNINDWGLSPSKLKTFQEKLALYSHEAKQKQINSQ